MIDLIDRSPIDLKALRALVAVADQGSFRAAAKALGYTQSAISHQVGTLERALEAPLFTRPGGRGQLGLTPAGDVAYLRARRVLGEVETLGADVAAVTRGERQTLRIGIFQTATTELLPGALRTLREERPDVEVDLTEIRTTPGPTTSSPTASSTSRSWSTRAPTSGSSRSRCSTTRG